MLEEIDNVYKVTWKNFLKSVGNEKRKRIDTYLNTIYINLKKGYKTQKYT